MKVLDFDYDTEHGFCWIVVDGKSDGDEWVVQCCLVTEKDADGEWIGHKTEVDQDDCGHDEGICGEVNEKAFDYWGQNRCMKALFDRAKAAGIELI